MNTCFHDTRALGEEDSPNDYETFADRDGHVEIALGIAPGSRAGFRRQFVWRP
jgi:hypothetical protein